MQVANGNLRLHTTRSNMQKALTLRITARMLSRARAAARALGHSSLWLCTRGPPSTTRPLAPPAALSVADSEDSDSPSCLRLLATPCSGRTASGEASLRAAPHGRLVWPAKATGGFRARHGNQRCGLNRRMPRGSASLRDSASPFGSFFSIFVVRGSAREQTTAWAAAVRPSACLRQRGCGCSL